jgi:hypothetical protein
LSQKSLPKGALAAIFGQWAADRLNQDNLVKPSCSSRANASDSDATLVVPRKFTVYCSLPPAPFAIRVEKSSHALMAAPGAMKSLDPAKGHEKRESPASER